MRDQTAPGGPPLPGDAPTTPGPLPAVPPPLPPAVADIVEELDDDVIPEIVEDLGEDLEDDDAEIAEDLGEMSIDPVALADVAAQLEDDDPGEFEGGYDRTAPVLKPALAVAIDDTVELLTAELAALARAGNDAPQTAIEDINLRLALFVWDIFTDDESAGQYLTRAGNHPLTPALVLGLGIETRDAERVAWAERALMASRTDDRRRAYAALDAAEV